MSINQEYLNDIAKKMKEFLDEEKVQSAFDVGNPMNEIFQIDYKRKVFISVQMKPSLNNETAYTISYNSEFGTPLEIK